MCSCQVVSGGVEDVSVGNRAVFERLDHAVKKCGDASSICELPMCFGLAVDGLLFDLKSVVLAGLPQAHGLNSVSGRLAAKRLCPSDASQDGDENIGRAVVQRSHDGSNPPKSDGCGRATFADVVNSRLICPGRYRWTVGQDQSVEVNIKTDGKDRGSAPE